MEIASYALAVNVNTGFVHRVVHISDYESNDEVDMEEWSDDPEHAKLVETAKKGYALELQPLAEHLARTALVHLRRLSGVLPRTQLRVLSPQLLALHLTQWVRHTTTTICTRGRKDLVFDTGRAA